MTAAAIQVMTVAVVAAVEVAAVSAVAVFPSKFSAAMQFAEFDLTKID